MKKVLLAAVAVAVLALAAWFLLSREILTPAPESVQNQGPEVPANDNSASIKKDIEALEVGNPDTEFKTIDADLNQL